MIKITDLNNIKNIDDLQNLGVEINNVNTSDLLNILNTIADNLIQKTENGYSYFDENAMDIIVDVETISLFTNIDFNGTTVEEAYDILHRMIDDGNTVLFLLTDYLNINVYDLIGVKLSNILSMKLDILNNSKSIMFNVANSLLNDLYILTLALEEKIKASDLNEVAKIISSNIPAINELIKNLKK